MSTRDLVGRPLVPFFDANDNVNEALTLDSHAHEQLEVDARVWDKELGYFVYPTEAQPRGNHSMPIPIKKAVPTPVNNDGTSGSFGKMLLTPDMLSRSAPTATTNGVHDTMGMTHEVAHHPIPVIDHDTRATTPRSASAKRASRQKNRSSTPTRNGRTKHRKDTSNQSQQPNDSGSSGEDRTGSDHSDKPNDKNKKDAKKTRTKQPPTPSKTKEDLSSNGKWAWSAFQSSPDPKSLPLPPFVAGGGSPGGGAMPPPMDPPKVEERLDPPMVAGSPPDAMHTGPPLPPPHPSSLEHSMTQDLRRMLNIGS